MDPVSQDLYFEQFTADGPKIFNHAPSYFQFYLQDLQNHTIDYGLSDSDIENRYRVEDGIISVLVISEFKEIPIEVEVLSASPRDTSEQHWDKIVECQLKFTSGDKMIKRILMYCRWMH